MNDTTQLVTKGERHCGTNLLTEVLKLTFGAAACPGSGRFVDSGRTCAACTADLHAEPRLPHAALQFDWHAEKVPHSGVSPITWVE